MSRTSKSLVGEAGENIAVRFLKNQGYSIMERNYKRPWGEIDIVAIKDKIVYFVEVKAMSLTTLAYEQSGSAPFSPEVHMNPEKVRRLRRAIESYLADRFREGAEPEFELDLVSVELDMERKKSRVRFLQGIELG
ncbi:MAG: hypothetical protein COV07_00905 [Candidatus Vogelbacteria bacterium CG10_big_fil_rev_8_21_14_0_10_45_14]|uniref:UPF0102 protein COV07_00905 n=1 Tax=Candidatus Vogelbacteria bacterium CG10_big_fil_rev_8_21_14_0_10_45_14 TaxID=1975042 RepID=A0A2H0RKS3_9BACT|nr:MAG: hypothetical protein COV07_00905 [Candidatus Vogelbacteria bacterium CG10_big_fil_rev_8_21_14_0_10_45_14]